MKIRVGFTSCQRGNKNSNLWRNNVSEPDVRELIRFLSEKSAFVLGVAVLVLPSLKVVKIIVFVTSI